MKCWPQFEKCWRGCWWWDFVDLGREEIAFFVDYLSGAVNLHGGRKWQKLEPTRLQSKLGTSKRPVIARSHLRSLQRLYTDRRNHELDTPN